MLCHRPPEVRPLPRRDWEWAPSILKDHLADEGRAADPRYDFAAFTLRRFTKESRSTQ